MANARLKTMASEMDCPSRFSNLATIFLKKCSFISCVYPVKPAATGIRKNKFSQLAGATEGSVTEDALT